MPISKALRRVADWEKEWLPQMPHLLEAQRQGFQVRALDERPTVPPSLLYPIRVFRSVGVDFSAFAAYCQLAGIDGARAFWLWERVLAIGEALADGGDGPKS